VSPEALSGGALAKVRDGDVICLDADQGVLEVLVSSAEWSQRQSIKPNELYQQNHAHGLGRELFSGMRHNVLSAEEGAVTWATHAIHG
jgi:phosphogluconate dehydratase